MLAASVLRSQSSLRVSFVMLHRCCCDKASCQHEQAQGLVSCAGFFVAVLLRQPVSKVGLTMKGEEGRGGLQVVVRFHAGCFHAGRFHAGGSTMINPSTCKFCKYQLF
jgi:hypothetical protein